MDSSALKNVTDEVTRAVEDWDGAVRTRDVDRMLEFYADHPSLRYLSDGHMCRDDALVSMIRSFWPTPRNRLPTPDRAWQNGRGRK